MDSGNHRPALTRSRLRLAKVLGAVRETRGGSPASLWSGLPGQCRDEAAVTQRCLCFARLPSVQSPLTPWVHRALCVPLCGCTVFASFPSSIPSTGSQKESRQPCLSSHLPQVHMRCCCTMYFGDAKVHQSINWYSLGEKVSLGGLSSKYPANRNMPVARLFSSRWMSPDFFRLPRRHASPLHWFWANVSLYSAIFL